MGWWKMGRKAGGISTKYDMKLVMGDEPVDIMQKAIDGIIKSYKNKWHREPTLIELQNCFKFCCIGFNCKNVKTIKPLFTFETNELLEFTEVPPCH